MNQNVPANLMLGEGVDTFDFFGMAKVQVVDSLDEVHLIAPAAGHRSDSHARIPAR